MGEYQYTYINICIYILFCRKCATGNIINMTKGQKNLSSLGLPSECLNLFRSEL